jgi:cytochrome c
MNKLMLAALLAAPFLTGVTPAQANPEEAMTKAGCMACHAKDKKMVGPSFQQIAAKYKDSKGQDVKAQLVQKVRAGGKGNFGPIPMAPNPPDKIGDADLGAALDFILKQ